MVLAPPSYDRYEDDTREAPGLKLVESKPREVHGSIFEDKATAEAIAQLMREGNGIYEPGHAETVRDGVDVQLSNHEQLLKNIKVELMEHKTTNGATAIERYTSFEGDTNRFDMISEDGSYQFVGFTPGVYQIKFTWGEGTTESGEVLLTKTMDGTTEIIPINYKSTILQEDWYNRVVHDQTFFRNMSGVDFDRSVTIDNQETRNRLDTELNSHGSGTNNGYNFRTNVNNPLMDSWTVEMSFPIEEPDDAGEVDDYKWGGNKMWEVRGINLGIIRRPIQEVEMVKRISNVKIIYSSTEVIANADIDENGKLHGQTDYITYLGDRNDPKSAQLKIEMDNEVLQNSSIELTYDYIFKNKSEYDYTTWEYYVRGIANNQYVVRLAPSKILDYLGAKTDIIVGSSINVNNKWQLQKLENITEYVTSDVAGADATKQNNIYLTDVLKNTYVAPQEDVTIQMAVQRRLQSGEETNMINQVEVVEVTKPSIPGGNPNLESTGSEIIQTPGNFIPTGSSNEQSPTEEPDNAMAETVIVIPSTGGNKNYTPYIIIGIASLVLLAGGAYIIKKRVLN